MPKKGGKKKTKGGKAAAEKTADAVKTETPGHEVEDKVKYGEGTNGAPTEAATQAAAPDLSTKTPSTAPPAVTEPKEPAPPAEATTKEGVQEAVDKARASKAGQVGKLDGGDAEGTAVLPEVTSKEPTLTPENYPSTTETAAEESAMSTAATMQPEPKTSEAAATEPAVAPAETNGAHVKRPYEKPIFTEDEMKPHKMAKHEEEAPKKAENGTHKASPAAVAAAAAAIGSSTKTPEKEKSTAAPAADASERDPKLPEKVFKPGEEPAREAPKSEPVKEEPVKAKEESKKTEAAAAGEPAEHKKEKGGFFSWLKRKFK